MYLKKANKTALQSQRLITEALFGLMRNKSFQQITVKEICQKAAVGRKTFYRNFELREDVIDFWLDEIREQYWQQIQDMGWDRQLRHHFAFVKQYSDIFIILYRNGFYQWVHEKFSPLLPKTMPIWSTDSVEQEYRSEYIRNGIEAIERVWVSRNFEESIDRIVEIVHTLLSQQKPVVIEDASEFDNQECLHL